MWRIQITKLKSREIKCTCYYDSNNVLNKNVHPLCHLCASATSNMTFKIHLTQAAVVVMISKLQLISFFSAIIIYSLYSYDYSKERSTFLITIRNLIGTFSIRAICKLLKLFSTVMGDGFLDKNKALILSATIDFLLITKRFDVNLL